MRHILCILGRHRYKFWWDDHGYPLSDPPLSIPDETWTCQREGCDAEVSTLSTLKQERSGTKGKLVRCGSKEEGDAKEHH